jgi:hypothetical protein
MTPALTNALTGVRDYDELPESIKLTHTVKEYLWLTDAQKSDLLRNETEPEWIE